jgi:cytoskeletal protein CcmA (bactofilin family)
VAAKSSPENAADATASVLRIDGCTTGPIHHAGTVCVGARAALIGDIHAAHVVVEGSVSGNVQAAVMLDVAATATIVGDLQAPRIAVARGAQLRGNITMRAALLPPTDLDEMEVDDLLAGSQRA